MGASDPDALRAELLERWEHAAAGWSRQAQRVGDWGMPVARWMIEHSDLRPGLRVLELAAGPGETGFLAAELISPGGTLVSSDGAETMLDAARARAAELGIDNVEFKRLELEWIDLETASVDRVLCRWGVMLTVDPEAALRETRRVLRPGGRIALAVWDEAPLNPWGTIPSRALVELGHTAPPDPGAPGPFALSAPGRLQELLETAGFVDVVVEAVDPTREFSDVDEFVAETRDLSILFDETWQRLSGDERVEVTRKIEALTKPYLGEDGSLRLPGRSLVAAADA